ncbi:hypothetical protein EV714DRAFT_253315 [Schizophyllum commune]
MPALNKKKASGREQLARLKREHQKRPLYATHARNQQRNADEATPEVQATWFENMKKVMNEIDWATEGRAIPLEGPLHFLDLGCCPGGFSSYILKKNSDACGVGVSLPSGHDYLLEEEFRPRHELCWADLLRYPMQESRYGARAKGFDDMPWGLRCRHFDIVVLDGHPLRSQKVDTSNVGPRLLVTQLLIALQTARRGGTIIAKLSGVDRPDTQAILWMLDALSDRLTTCKPVSMHATRDTFYVVAEGMQKEGWVGMDVDGGRYARVLGIEEVIHGLEERWADVTFGGGKRIAEGRMWEAVGCGEGDKVAFRKRMDELAEPVVLVQRLALEGLAKEEAARPEDM